MTTDDALDEPLPTEAPTGRGKVYAPSEADRLKVMAYAGVGLSQLQMAELLRISQDTLQRHYRHELDNGKPMANARVAAVLFNKAMQGDTVSCIFWLKCMGGWTEPRAPQPIIGGSEDAPPIRAEHSVAVRYLEPPKLPAPE